MRQISSRPKKRSLHRVLAGVVVSTAAVALAQSPSTDNWQENAVPPPAHFKTEGLHIFDVSVSSSLVYGIDPDTLMLGTDGVVRYVLVARSKSGATNVLFEGIRCKTAEMKTFARWNNQGSWISGAEGAWRPLNFSGPTNHAMHLARDGICEGKTPNGSARNMLQALQRGRVLSN